MAIFAPAMRLLICVCALAGALMAAVPSVFAQTTGPVRAENLVSHELISESTALVPGQTHWLALRQTIEPEWHTYWENAGDAGGPTTIEWRANHQVAISPIHWPTPQVIPFAGLLSHAYKDQAMLLLQVDIPADFSGSSLRLTGKIDYLVCADICIPGSDTVDASFPIATSSGPSANAADIQKARAILPGKAPFNVSLSGPQMRIEGPGIRSNRITSIRFLPSASGILDHNADQPLSIADGAASLNLPARGGGTVPTDLSGMLLVTERVGEQSDQTVTQGFIVALGESDYVNGGEPVALANTAIDRGFELGSFGIALAFAFMGGVILNLMPCVFPILSLKALSIASSSGSHTRAHAWSFFAGVMVSFAILAALFLGLRASGAALGWGFQFQSPAFIAIMAALFFALGLNMLGTFEVGHSVQGAGDALTRREGHSGSFFTGALATIAATPCTAPFMGAALGYALSQSTTVAFSVIMALGLGFAAPMTMIGLSKRIAAILPKPGPWMVTLRRWLALPLLATVVWLAWILWLQTGSGGLAILLSGLIALGLVLVLFGKSRQAVMKVGAATAAVLLSAGVAWAVSQQLTTIDPAAPAAENQWSEARVEELRNEGKAVFVDFTAAWCITCKVNEAAVIDTADFRTLLKTSGVEMLVGDWTTQDARITAILERHGRAGVPLYLLYPPDMTKQPTVLPQILTQGGMEDAIAAL